MFQHVEVGSKTSLNDDNRSNLMSEIRQGFNLRAVSSHSHHFVMRFKIEQIAT